MPRKKKGGRRRTYGNIRRGRARAMVQYTQTYPGKKGHRRRRKTYRRSVPVVRLRRRGAVLVRNPTGIVGTVLHGVTDAAAIIGGKVAVRKIAGYIPFAKVTVAAGDPKYTTQVVMQALLQTGLAVGVGVVADKALGRRSEVARMVTAGGFVAPLESLIKLAGVDFINSALAGDGGMGYIGAYPTRTSLSRPNAYGRLGAYPPLDTAAAPGYGLEGYTS